MPKRDTPWRKEEYALFIWEREAREILKAQNDIHPPDHDEWKECKGRILSTLERWGMNVDDALDMAHSKGYANLYCLLLA